MQTLLRHWPSEAAGALRQLAARRACLLLALLALNALALPYSGLIHDARLYSVQVLNRVEGGSYADDLFFRYGSQDQYSFFSPLVAPLAGVLGLETTFFLLYLLAKALLFWAAIRLIEAVVSDRVLSTLSLLFLAVTIVPFGGFSVFSVNESFLTPRLFACAFTLFALERTLAGRYAAAAGLLVLGGLMHPVMASGGVAVLLLWLAWTRLPRRAALWLGGAAALAGLAVLAYTPLGYQLCGQMDEEWVAAVWQASPYAVPPEWTFEDWFRLALAFAVVLTAAALAREPRLTGLATAAAVAGAGGLLLAIVSSLLGYAVLFQGQLYRALWLVAFLALPLSVWLVGWLWQRSEGWHRVAALGLLCVLWLPTSFDEPYAFVFVFPFLVITRRGLEKEPRSPGWLWESVAGALVIAVAFGAAFRLWVIWKHHDFLIERADGMDFWRLLIAAPGILAWILVAVAAAVVIQRRRLAAPALAAGALAVAAAVQATFFLLPQAESYREGFKRYHDDVAAVARFLEGKPGRPTVYWCNSNLGTVWLDLRAHSYFQRQQVQGLLFSRDTAAEARRRAQLVGPFEMEYMQRESVFGLDRWTELMEHFHGVTCETAAPGRADLERLCGDEKVDYVIVAQRFDGLYSVSSGRFYVYDCRRVRAALKSEPARQGSVAMAGATSR